MRELTDHKVNPANDILRILVMDEPGEGGACHEYKIVDPQGRFDAAIIRFQNGPIGENGEGVNGITHEALLAILADRLRSFQAGPFACNENADALFAVELAQRRLHDRTLSRMQRGVEGTHKV